jgi:ubiquinone/menaquinone biosynthesis C-methylase UbiE
MDILRDSKTEKIAEIILGNCAQKFENILVVGCGSGLEAAILAQRLEANVIGIDIEQNFDGEAAKFADLEVGDATSLRFADSSFDFVYSYHALEHIDNPLLALKEMKRVLKNGGGYWIGTPNRNRLIGYVGSKTATLGEKVQWNIADWKARLRGNFKNELGAHAGFSFWELKSLLSSVFSTNIDVSDIYYKKIYSGKELLINFLELSHLSQIAYPSIYFMGSKSR